MRRIFQIISFEVYRVRKILLAKCAELRSEKERRENVLTERWIQTSKVFLIFIHFVFVNLNSRTLKVYLSLYEWLDLRNTFNALRSIFFQIHVYDLLVVC